MAVWDDTVTPQWEPPNWLLTGHMLLWNDGSPAHIDMAPFRATDRGWQAELMISRSALRGTRWLTLRMTFTREVRKDWQSHGASARVRALQLLATHLRQADWSIDDLGVLELK